VLRPGEPIGLSPDEITVADLLKGQGYATKIIGKWHCGDQPPFLPTNHGFDSYYGIPYSNDMGISRGYPRMPPLPLVRDQEVIQAQPDQASLTERYTEEAVRFIRENQRGPFFLYFAHMYVHGPIYAPDRFLQQSRDGKYGAAVEHIDFVAQVLFHELERLGLDGETLVVFTSDNGANRRRAPLGSNRPLRGFKGSSWEGGLRVPCIARWPGVVPAGSTCAELASAMDFLPTLARIAGAETPSDRIIDGRDVWSLMIGEPDAQSRHDAFFYYGANTMRAMRMGDWKLHMTKPKGTDEPGWGDEDVRAGMLFQLREDAGESVDLSEAHPEIASEMQERADLCREDLGDQARGVEGKNRRPVGWVDNPKPLISHDPAHAYMVAMYD
jgi:arylsulfatase A-like enzyme